MWQKLWVSAYDGMSVHWFYVKHSLVPDSHNVALLSKYWVMTWLAICPQSQDLTYWPLGDVAIIFRSVIMNHVLWIKCMNIGCEIALIWMWENRFAHKLALVQRGAWCCQATSHCLIQCWPRLKSPYDITRPQWFNTAALQVPFAISM